MSLSGFRIVLKAKSLEELKTIIENDQSIPEGIKTYLQDTIEGNNGNNLELLYRAIQIIKTHEKSLINHRIVVLPGNKIYNIDVAKEFTDDEYEQILKKEKNKK